MIDLRTIPNTVYYENPQGDEILFVMPNQLVATAKTLQEKGFSFFLDLTAVDYSQTKPTGRDESIGRFELVVQLRSHAERRRVRLRVPLAGDEPVVPSISPVFAGAEFFEREAFDLMGVVFEGHPDLTRIVMPEEWEGHPLRKDYAVGRVPVQFRYTESRYSTERKTPDDQGEKPVDQGGRQS